MHGRDTGVIVTRVSRGRESPGSFIAGNVPGHGRWGGKEGPWDATADSALHVKIISEKYDFWLLIPLSYIINYKLSTRESYMVPLQTAATAQSQIFWEVG